MPVIGTPANPPGMRRRLKTCIFVLAVAITNAPFERALASVMRCPSYGCLDEQCELDDYSTTIESCSNALYADEQAVKFWLTALQEHKITYALYLTLTTPINQHTEYTAAVLKVIREMMQANGKVCFEHRNPARFDCKELTEPKGTAPFQRHY